MPTNPFEDEASAYLVLINDEGQHSLWNAAIEIPDGWRATHGPDSRHAGLAHIEQNWTDMRPRSLVELDDAARRAQGGSSSLH
jgi:MbtH protein